MASVKQLFDEGKLTAATEALVEEVKSHPTDAARRTFLFELLAFAGQYERAAKQLEVIVHQNVQSEWATQVYTNILHAEGLRTRLFTQGLKPEFLLDPPPYVSLHLQAINAARENQLDQAQALVDEAEEARPAVGGTINDQPFVDFLDCDDFVRPVLELILIRDYIWLPIEQVRELEVSKPERPRDLLWAPVRVVLADGSQRRAYMPTRYYHSTLQADDKFKLGRATDWVTRGGPVAGLGQRQFLAGDDAFAVLELPPVTFGA
jgi:type VI secretion system protein ImpE